MPFVSLLALPAALAAALALGTTPRVVWLSALPAGQPTRILLTPRGLLLGSDAGLYRLDETHGWTLVLTRGGVRDLARSSDTTWIAAGAGLFAWRDGSEGPRPVGLGAGARVRSLAVDPEGRTFVGTEVGLFVRGPGETKFVRELSLPAGAVAGVRSVGDQVWAATRGVLWRRDSGGRFTPTLRRLGDGWWELRAAVSAEGVVWLVVPRGLWRVSAEGVRSVELGVGELRGLAVPATSAPAVATGWIASTRGLFSVPWARVEKAPPKTLLGGDAFDLAVGSTGEGEPRVVVAAAGGVATLPLGSSGDGGGAVALRKPAAEAALPELDLALLHRAVLRYQGIGPAGINRLEERARTAALLPELQMGVGYTHDRGRDRDFDEVVSSGARYALRDHGRERDTELDLSLRLTWDLADYRDPDRAIAVSRERRELVELRDQVLERVNRLYFEWLRVRLRIAAPSAEAERDGGERQTLQIQARELAAQLDGWTGGVFTRLVRNSPPESRSTP